MLYAALGLSQNKIPLYDYSEWKSSRPAVHAPNLTNGFVIEMPTAKSRPNLYSMGTKLKNLHSNDIWKMGGAHNVSLNIAHFCPPSTSSCHQSKQGAQFCSSFGQRPCCMHAPTPELHSHTHLLHAGTRCPCFTIQALHPPVLTLSNANTLPSGHP